MAPEIRPQISEYCGVTDFQCSRLCPKLWYGPERVCIIPCESIHKLASLFDKGVLMKPLRQLFYISSIAVLLLPPCAFAPTTRSGRGFVTGS